MTNEFKYAVTNGDSVIAIIYEHEKYGRTVVILEKLDLNSPVTIWDKEANTPLSDTDFLEFIYNLLPVK